MPDIKVSPLAKEHQLEFRRLTMENYQEVVDLISSDYTQGYVRNTYGHIDNMNERHVVRVKMKLQQPWSIGIYEKDSNELLAITMNTVENTESLEPSANDYKQYGFRENLKEQQINRFFVILQAGLFDVVGVDKVFYLGMITVRLKYRRNNLSALLVYASQRLAWESGCKYMVMCSTTEFLGKAMEKDGWTLLREITYSNYDAEHKTDLFANAKYPYVRAQLICKMTCPPADYMPITTRAVKIS